MILGKKCALMRATRRAKPIKSRVKNVHKEGNLAPRPLRYQTGYVGPDGTIKMCSLAHSLSLRPKHVSVKLATDASAIVECSSASLN